MTTFIHTALVCRSEDNADRFYVGLLGLEKAEPKTLPAVLSRATFGVEADLTIINYTGDGIHFEIFIADDIAASPAKIEHTCIEVTSRSKFLEDCDRLNITVNQVPKGSKTLLFVEDLDGNLFEVKTRSD